jgi:hypothetical protein
MRGTNIKIKFYCVFKYSLIILIDNDKSRVLVSHFTSDFLRISNSFSALLCYRAPPYLKNPDTDLHISRSTQAVSLRRNRHSQKYLKKFRNWGDDISEVLLTETKKRNKL